MTTYELKANVRVGTCLSGQFEVEIFHRGKSYTCSSNNTLAYDRIDGSDDWNSDREVHCGYTVRQAYQALYIECKKKNNLL